MCLLGSTSLGLGLRLGLSRIGTGTGIGHAPASAAFIVTVGGRSLHALIRTFRSTATWSLTCQYQRSTHQHLFDHNKFSYSLGSSRFLSSSTYKLVRPIPSEQRHQNHNQNQGHGHSDQNRNRRADNSRSVLEERHRTVLYYLCAVAVLVAGASYAAVPLYRIFCQSYSYGGTVATHAADKDLSKMKKVKHRELTVKFNADKSSSLQWSFVPRQSEIILYPGETALAFYTATNSTSRPIDGISTYNVIPYEVGQYFNKIQCFCFEEQRLNPGETVELPVFFYIDPEFSNDPKMEDVDTILLSYTFFEAKEVPHLNLPSLSSLKLTS